MALTISRNGEGNAAEAITIKVFYGAPRKDGIEVP